MISWRYDGTFEGFLSLLYHSWSRKILPSVVAPPWRYRQGLLGDWEDIATNPSRSSRVWKYLCAKLSFEGRKRLYRAWLQDGEHTELLLLRYISLVANGGRMVEKDLLHPVVQQVWEAERGVLREMHLLTGLIRFRKIREGYYASLEPDFRVLPLLGDHFAARYSDMSWIVHDLYREEALVFSPSLSWRIGPLKREEIPRNSSEEENWQALWRQYYRIMGVEDRENPKLRRRFMPRRYWSHLVEVPEEKKENFTELQGKTVKKFELNKIYSTIKEEGPREI